MIEWLNNKFKKSHLKLNIVNKSIKIQDWAKYLKDYPTVKILKIDLTSKYFGSNEGELNFVAVNLTYDLNHDLPCLELNGKVFITFRDFKNWDIYILEESRVFIIISLVKCDL